MKALRDRIIIEVATCLYQFAWHDSAAFIRRPNTNYRQSGIRAYRRDTEFRYRVNFIVDAICEQMADTRRIEG